ncbi:oxygen-independent coproporphyrinogen III oxidase [Methylocella silvestris]|uniref:Coproporphyrinogen-III oxidase n=1 Tax=Methylocella silvestris TaxID=199596 RepID=A0A2J7TF58_METSI|nr:oxygen-independent coproporphyrinogen III oxidase [Methylocella silvestris]PNG25411.1 oxygen-independent coproporphyrinogen III oxidase [Methylocella silvestris]
MTHDPIPADVVARHATALPRYTSYPTANHFHAGVDHEAYRGWLGALPAGEAVSAYLHIPFCTDLCWYCGCSTKATRRYEPVAAYVDTLLAEIDATAAALPGKLRLDHLHWGGGSPDILAPADIERLAGALKRCFAIEPGAEFAVEIDPRLMSGQKASAFVRAGVTRVSLGVQDFDEEVQEAIGRIQSFAATKEAVNLFRARGVGSINIDLVYGLPRQSVSSLSRTLDQVLSLSPDRIALFGYAHLPHRMRNQRLIDEAALPPPLERFAQARAAAEGLRRAGYVALGIDHFAKPGDSLADGKLNRNFQGYTADGCETLIGFGASAIGRLPQGFAQNAPTVGVYAALVEAQGLASVRGFALTPDDRLRAHVIERLMCDFALDFSDLERGFGAAAASIKHEAEAVIAEDAEGFVERAPGGFRLTERGKPFVRHICARFDAYLSPGGSARHSLAI